MWRERLDKCTVHINGTLFICIILLYLISIIYATLFKVLIVGGADSSFSKS